MAREKLRPDVNELAFRTVQAAIGQADKPTPPGVGDKHPEAVRRGKRGGKRGGAVRAKKLTRKERVKIARKGAKARWKGSHS